MDILDILLTLGDATDVLRLLPICLVLVGCQGDYTIATNDSGGDATDRNGDDEMPESIDEPSAVDPDVRRHR